MDSLTHIVLGGCIGEVFAGRQLGRRSVLLGALMQSIPDIDFVASFFLDPVSDLIVHRGITHSLVFLAVCAPLLGYVGSRSMKGISTARWIWFVGAEMLVHLFLDSFNAYGTGLFEPFASNRVSFHAVFVADPLFSIVPGIAFLFLLFRGRFDSYRMRMAKVAMSYVMIYLGFCIFSKTVVNAKMEQHAKQQGFEYSRHFITPTPFNSILWYGVFETENGYYIGYRSLLDGNALPTFTFFDRNEALLGTDTGSVNVKQLKLFSQGYYTVSNRDSSRVLNDLRFGQVHGWDNPSNPFVFYYYLDDPENNSLMVQRGRFAGWNRRSVGRFIRRIAGNHRP
jgi:inner membrane protein